jgi:hypothetical protein
VSGIERNGRRRELRRAKLSAIKGSSVPGRRRNTALLVFYIPVKRFTEFNTQLMKN